MSERVAADVLDRLVGFGRFLRENGMVVGTGRILTFARAATTLDPFDRRQLHAAARASLVSRPEDFTKLDALFGRYFGAGLRPPEPAPEAHADATAVPSGAGEPPPAEEPEDAAMEVSSSWSPAGAADEDADEGAA